MKSALLSLLSRCSVVMCLVIALKLPAQVGLVAEVLQLLQELRSRQLVVNSHQAQLLQAQRAGLV